SHDRAELRNDLERVSLVGEALELRQLSGQPLRIDRWPAQPQDLRMRRLADGLVLSPQLLVELLPGPRADVLDRNVGRPGDLVAGKSRLLAREADHVRRQVDDLHRLAHVEDEDLSATADRAGLHDE